MTVTNTAAKVTYQGNNATTTFAFSFPVSGPQDIACIITFFDGTFIMANPIDFTVTVNPESGANPTPIGGTVLYPKVGPPLDDFHWITIVRILGLVQDTSIANQSIIYPPVIEEEFDYLTMADQQLSERLDRTFKVPITDPPPAPLPPLSLRKNSLAIFDDNGNLTSGVDTGGAAISSAMLPVVTAPTLDQARTSMGVPPIDSPAFTGNPTAPTPAVGDNDTSVATTAYVQTQIGAMTGQFASGTRLVFQQSAAPAGWTKDLTHNDKALRIVNTAVSSGGALGFSTVFGRTATDGHAMTITEMPVHNHAVSDPTHSHGVNDPTHAHTAYGNTYSDPTNVAPGSSPPLAIGDTLSFGTTANATGISIFGAGTGISLFNTGGGASHSHPMDNRVLYVDVIIAQRD